MFRIYGLSLILVVLIMCSGCASIFSKSNYPVAVSSEPNEAMFQVVDGDGRIIFNGKTPTVISLKSGDGYFKKAVYNVIFQKEGYMPQTRSIESSFDSWYLANCLWGGTDLFVGFLVIDPLTGAMWKLDENLYVELLPIETQSRR